MCKSVHPIDYRYDNGRFLVSASSLAVANRALLSSSENGVTLGTGSWKIHLSEPAERQKDVGNI
jgi:hypothetical protein